MKANISLARTIANFTLVLVITWKHRVVANEQSKAHKTEGFYQIDNNHNE